MKKLILPALIALLINQISFANCLNGWSYATPITITNSLSTPLVNFQVKVTVNTAALISAGYMQPNGADIRFTRGNCCNFLCHTVESGMNTSATDIWIKIDSLPANGSVVVAMNYGNGSTGSADDPVCTFDMWEPFDNQVNHFSPTCGSGTYTVSGGNANISWFSEYVMLSDVTFDMDTVYTAEMNVISASGNWPGINFSRITPGSHFGYSMLLGSGSVRLGEAGGSAPDYCRGENWASALMPYSNVVGLWSVTWIATGSITGQFPSVGTINSTSVTHTRSSDLKVCIGGIANGSGNMVVDWVRVRKYAATMPSISIGTQGPLAFQAVSLGPDTSMCSNTGLFLDAGPGFTHYLWSTGDTTQTIITSGTGTYIVSVIDIASCPSSDTIVIQQYPAPVVDLGPDQDMCSTDTITLDAGTGFTGYNWSTGNTAQTQTVTVSGLYIVEVSDNNGCIGSDSVTINLYTNPISSFTTSTSGLLAMFTNSSSGGTTYFWDFGDGNTSTAIAPTHMYTNPGSYQVCLTVTSADGCSTTTCRQVNVAHIGFDTFTTSDFHIYPNPASENFFIQMPEDKTVVYEIMDIAGRVIANGMLQPGTNKIDVSAVSSGVYIVRLDHNSTLTRRIVIQ